MTQKRVCVVSVGYRRRSTEKPKGQKWGITVKIDSDSKYSLDEVWMPEGGYMEYEEITRISSKGGADLPGLQRAGEQQSSVTHSIFTSTCT